MHTSLILYGCFIHLLQLINAAKAVLVNVTVDDTIPDPLTGLWITYTTGGWNRGPCSNCDAKPDKKSMNNMTWHDSTYYPANSDQPATEPLNAMFNFHGNALYVFCAFAPSYNTNMTFYIDGENVGQFERIPPASDWEYDVLVYSNSSLAARSHQFTLTNGQYGYGGQKSLVLFNYVIYSYEVDIESLTTPPTPTSSTTSPISTPSTSPISQDESRERIRTEVARAAIPVVERSSYVK
ncbi:hypothetical protein BDQ17DRAFT_1430648 [Cyathus striatus]|nr:hypothetical protein BDQ17DRAFT_1430648 [Cyathus striatus]